MPPSQRTLHEPRHSWYQALIDKSGRPRFDVNPVWADPRAFSALAADIQAHFAGVPFDKILAFDALGFILGGYLAARFDRGLVPLRKKGKLPLPADRVEAITFADYDERETTFELGRGYVAEGERVLLVDEWMGTGAQMQAAIDLVERLGVTVAGIAVLYVFPDFPRNFEIVRKYETFTANCLKSICTHSNLPQQHPYMASETSRLDLLSAEKDHGWVQL